MEIVFNNSNCHLAVLSDVSLHHDAMSFSSSQRPREPKKSPSSLSGAGLQSTVFSFVLACHREEALPTLSEWLVAGG